MYMNYFKGEQYMFCTKCGAKNPEDAKFCYKCGNEIYKTIERLSDNSPKSSSVDFISDNKKVGVSKNVEKEKIDNKTKSDVEEESGNPLATFWNGILDFDGKIGRRDFWAAVIIMAAINVVILALCLWLNFMPLLWLYDILFFIASLSATIRRLHDVDKSGAFVLLNFVPLVGQIILLVMLLQKGTVKSYVNPRWDGVMAIATIVLVMGGFLVGGVAYSDYQHQQEIQDEVSYDSDYDY